MPLPAWWLAAPTSAPPVSAEPHNLWQGLSTGLPPADTPAVAEAKRAPWPGGLCKPHETPVTLKDLG